MAGSIVGHEAVTHGIHRRPDSVTIEAACRDESTEDRVLTEQLRLMAVHAHPDDESSKGAATMAKYVSEGVDVLVVTCTGGERGSILNPKLQGDAYIEEHIHEVRKKEMDEAREILGVKQEWLGFVDSGLPEGDPLPPLPEGCFALAGRRRGGGRAGAADPRVQARR